MPKDEQGNILNYDGTTDCTQFLQWFDAWCESRGFGGVVSRNNYKQPHPPLDAMGRMALGIPNKRGSLGVLQEQNKDMEVDENQDVDLELIASTTSVQFHIMLSVYKINSYKSAGRR
jgi:hypothetical protein